MSLFLLQYGQERFTEKRKRKSDLQGVLSLSITRIFDRLKQLEDGIGLRSHHDTFRNCHKSELLQFSIPNIVSLHMFFFSSQIFFNIIYIHHTYTDFLFSRFRLFSSHISRLFLSFSFFFTFSFLHPCSFLPLSSVS